MENEFYHICSICACVLEFTHDSDTGKYKVVRHGSLSHCLYLAVHNELKDDWEECPECRTKILDWLAKDKNYKKIEDVDDGSLI